MDQDLLRDLQRRTRELEALYATAGDLSALRDVGEVLAAIVRRGRQLLGTDVAYLMLLDDDEQLARMRVGEGIQTPEFMDITLDYGEGLGGLVAETGMPQWSSDYFSDKRFAPRIDSVVREEALVSILGVPLTVGSKVIGVLFASERHSREFSHDDVALLASLASHAAIALENANLFESTREAVKKWRDASARVEQQNRLLQRAAALHERLTQLVLVGEHVEVLAGAVAEVIGGRVFVLDAQGLPVTPTDGRDLTLERSDLDRAVDGKSSIQLDLDDATTARLAPARAGQRRLGFLLHVGDSLQPADVRALERAAMVTALLLLDRRTHDEARFRAMADLLAELLAEPDPGQQQVRRRAEAAGLSLPAPPVVALEALAQPDLSQEVRLDAALDLALRADGLGRVEGRKASLLLPSNDPAAAARETAQQLTQIHGQPVTVGAAGPFPDLAAAAAGLAQAHAVARVLEVTGRVGGGATAEDLGVYTLLLSEAGREQLDEFIRTTIGPLREADRDARLARTLEAYFEVGGQTGALAEALHIHVNTLYQRLERIDRLLGPDWRRGEQSLQVHLAVRLAKLLNGNM